MSSPRTGLRQCPHCKESILESAAVCPACRHHLRFENGTTEASSAELTPFQIEGSFRNPVANADWEYSIVVKIRNERGEEIAHKLIGVGLLNPNEQRSFSFRLEMAPRGDKGGGKERARTRPIGVSGS